MSDVLDRVAHSEVVVEGWSRELSRKLALHDLFGEGESETSAAKGVDQLLDYLASLMCLWINSSRVRMLKDSPALVRFPTVSVSGSSGRQRFEPRVVC